MKNFLKLQCNYQSSAKVVDGSLIISLPDAVTPVVWRMELASVKASALEVKEHEKGFMLMLKTPRGETHDIAPFETKEAAVNALMRVSHALQNASGNMFSVPIAQDNMPPRSAAAAQKKGSAWKWVAGLGGLVIVMIMFSYLASLSGPMQQSAATSPASVSEDLSGVPQSADDLLRGF